MKVLIIIPYFGIFPPWIDYFIQSCKANPSFQWLLFSNCEEPQKLPGNITFEKRSLTDFNKLASLKLNIKIQIENPYKICDLRPAFGVIFEDYLENYDYWGYSDLDLIYGNLSTFISKQVIGSYDIISTRYSYISGHFALYKNASPINHLFLKSKAYSRIFNNSKVHYAFDERINFLGKRLFSPTSNITLVEIYSYFERIVKKTMLKILSVNTSNRDITSLARSAEAKGEISVYQKDIVRSDLWFYKRNIQNWEVVWDNGKLIDTYNNEELLHFHFIRSKRYKSFIVPETINDKDFIITRKGIELMK